MRAAVQDGSYPRPQLVRDRWASLDGSWGFAHDDDDQGVDTGWFEPAASGPFDRDITVPFPPESSASGIGDTAFHPVVWYRRVLDDPDLPPSGNGDRTLIHFGAVDFTATVWCDGVLVGQHVGGQTPFTVEITQQRSSASDPCVLVVRAEDDPHDRSIPRGKQDWELEPHGIWYHRTTGIWQTAWAEVVPELRITNLWWTADIDAGAVRCEVELSERPDEPLGIEIVLAVDGLELTRGAIVARAQRITATLDPPQLHDDAQRAGLLWSPDQPTLIDASVDVRDGAGRLLDQVDSYLGLRSVSVGDGCFRLNGEPLFLRAVLDQGYAEDTHLAHPGTGRLREDVELILSLGFNAVRVHQKAEDPRFLYWADRLGLLVWGEAANAHEFSARSAAWLTDEWQAIVRRDRSHPCVVAWVPINESWGVDQIAVAPEQVAYARSLSALTRELDPTRPVVSNDGWEHVDSDILGVHDYASQPRRLKRRYGGPRRVRATLGSEGPAKRRIILDDGQRARFERGDAPLMITEFGGVSYAGADGTWGYATVSNDNEYAMLLRSLFEALRSCPGVAGVCYTQFIDTLQETNGLLRADRTPKLPVEIIRSIVTGDATSAD